jgi:pimeloyl-ACP methyl ester carboxylesterase
VIEAKDDRGYSHNGLPYNRLGDGPRTLVIFQGLAFDNKPLTGLMAMLFLSPYTVLAKDFTMYVVMRKPGLPDGYSMKDMADDYATMIREEFGGPVDVVGISTGGSIVQHFAAEHPDLVRKLIIHSSAHTLSDSAKSLQLRVASFAGQRRWRDAYAALTGPMFPHDGIMKPLARPVIWFVSLLAGMLGSPEDPSDLVVTIMAEDKHDFKGRLSEITAPTLVVAGDRDPFYSEALFRETAEGIPNARLILYQGMGHPASGKQFRQDVIHFMDE